MKRRQFIKLGSTAGIGALLPSACGESESASLPDAQTIDIDSGALCSTTEADALGPFFEEGAPMRGQIADAGEAGERMILKGHVVGLDCATVISGVVVDIWQADKDGAYHDAGDNFRLRGQVTTDADGRFEIETIKPGHYENGPGAWRPAHIHMMFHRDNVEVLATQIYFEGDPYLAPNDGCSACGSDDLERIVALNSNAQGLLEGDLRIVL